MARSQAARLRHKSFADGAAARSWPGGLGCGAAEGGELGGVDPLALRALSGQRLEDLAALLLLGPHEGESEEEAGLAFHDPRQPSGQGAAEVAHGVLVPLVLVVASGDEVPAEGPLGSFFEQLPDGEEVRGL